MPAFRPSTKLFENDALTLIMWFLVQVLLKHTSKLTGAWCVFKFLRRRVDGKQMIRFQSESAAFKFFRCSVERGLSVSKILYVCKTT